MATNHGIESDPGLNFRMLITGGLLVALYALIVGILLYLGVSMSIVLVMAAVMLFVQYFFSASFAMFSMNAHVVTPEEEPRLHAIVDKVVALANMPKPKIGIA